MQTNEIKFNARELDKAATQFLGAFKPQKHFAFFGEMGVGKTTLITHICQQLGVGDLVSSPTFAIVNEYSTSEGEPAFHFDFYRIKEEEELLDIGFYDYCDPNAWIFIEWPEKAEHIIPDDFTWIKLVEEEDGTRTLTVIE